MDLLQNLLWISNLHPLSKHLHAKNASKISTSLHPHLHLLLILATTNQILLKWRNSWARVCNKEKTEQYSYRRGRVKKKKNRMVVKEIVLRRCKSPKLNLAHGWKSRSHILNSIRRLHGHKHSFYKRWRKYLPHLKCPWSRGASIFLLSLKTCCICQIPIFEAKPSCLTCMTRSPKHLHTLHVLRCKVIQKLSPGQVFIMVRIICLIHSEHKLKAILPIFMWLTFYWELHCK